MQKIKTRLIYPIFIPHTGCPFRCIYCNQNKITRVAPTTIYEIEEKRGAIKDFITKHKDNYKEIAFYGGSFTCLTREKITSYFAQITPYFDDKTFFRVSTRPDFLDYEILQFLKSMKVNTIELGIQSFADKVLVACKRGYNTEIAVNACKMVLSQGFNLSVQFLIGLPEEDLECIKHNIEKLIEIKPDFVRLYPLLVLKETELDDLYKNGAYKPLSLDDAVKICSMYLKTCNENEIKVIKIGLHSDIAKDDVVAGPFHERIGELVRERIRME